MKEQTILETITDFLNRLEISDAKVLRIETNIDNYNERAELEIKLCEHTLSTTITLTVNNLDAVNGCSACNKD